MDNFLAAVLVAMGSFLIGLLMGVAIDESAIRKQCEKIGAFTIGDDVFSCEKAKGEK